MTRARTPWLILYVLANLISALMISQTGSLIGDAVGSRLYSQTTLWVATLLVVLGYVIMLGPVFNLSSRIKVSQSRFGPQEHRVANRLGLALIVLQLGFMAFNLLTGVNVASSNNIRTDNPLGLLWVLVPVDALFIVYYATYRETKYFYPNLAIWLLSNFLRGWAGIFLFVIFFEFCRAQHARRISLPRVSLVALIVLTLYPILANLKWAIRASASTGLSLPSLIEALSNAFQAHDYLTWIGMGINGIIERLQVVSIVVEVIRLRDLLQEQFLQGAFAPFWMEGLHGLLFEKLFIGAKSLTIGVTFTPYFASRTFELGSWNVNIGFPSWLFIAPSLSPIFLLYTMALGVLSVYLVKRIGASPLTLDMLWFTWLTYLLPPWLSVFVQFLYALFFFLMAKHLLSRLPVVKWRVRPALNLAEKASRR